MSSVSEEGGGPEVHVNSLLMEMTSDQSLCPTKEDSSSINMIGCHNHIILLPNDSIMNVRWSKNDVLDDHNPISLY